MATEKLKHAGHNKSLIFMTQVLNFNVVLDNIHKTCTMVRYYFNYSNQCNLPCMKAQQGLLMIQMYEPNLLQLLMHTAEQSRNTEAHSCRLVWKHVREGQWKTLSVHSACYNGH